MSVREERGFSLVEVLLAVVLLSIGVMAMVGSSAMVTRMIGKGQQYTFVSQRARDRFELLRQLGAGTSPACTAAAFKSDSTVSNGITERWSVPNAGNERLVTVYLTYGTVKGTRADTVSATILCK
jgi:prepilin-type N-terminal cleavage/methylation domain-containing protein